MDETNLGYKLTEGYYLNGICIKFVIDGKDNNIIGAWRNEVYIPKIKFPNNSIILKALQVYNKEKEKNA